MARPDGLWSNRDHHPWRGPCSGVNPILAEVVGFEPTAPTLRKCGSRCLTRSFPMTFLVAALRSPQAPSWRRSRSSTSEPTSQALTRRCLLPDRRETSMFCPP